MTIMVSHPIYSRFFRFDLSEWKGASEGLRGLSSSVKSQGDLYLLTNEVWGSPLYEELGNPNTGHRGGGHVGVSGLQNFDIALARNSQFVVIINNQDTQTEIVDLALTKIRLPGMTRARFVDELTEAILELVPPHVNIDPPRNVLPAYMKAELDRPGSFLASEEGFQYIRQLALQDRVMALNLDLTEVRSTGNLVQLLNSRNLAIDSLYLSNVFDHVDLFSNHPLANLKLAAALRAFLAYPDALVVESQSQDMRLYAKVVGRIADLLNMDQRFALEY